MMTWIKFLVEAKKKAEIQAKGKAELKPRHIRRLREIWKSKYLDKRKDKLNALFEVEYSEHIQEGLKQENVLLKLVKNDYNFTGNSYNVPIILGKDHGVRE
jgi:hypothetical protein